jgi:hypothetical protein
VDITTVVVALIAAVSGTLGVEIVRAIALHGKADAEARAAEAQAELSLSAEGREVVRVLREQLGAELDAQRRRHEEELGRVLAGKAECEAKVKLLQDKINELMARVSRLEKGAGASTVAGPG